MKYKVTEFKSLKVALKELEQFIRDGAHVLRGKPLRRFGGSRPRELLANWLLAAVANASTNTEDYTFTSDPIGGDGIIYNLKEQKDWPTEHVIVPPAGAGETVTVEERIRDQVKKKQDKGGEQYARGKTLIVLNEFGNNERWHPNKAAKLLPDTSFQEIWAVGLYSVNDGEYTYYVTVLDKRMQTMPVWMVEINKDFTDWVVKQTQSPPLI